MRFSAFLLPVLLNVAVFAAGFDAGPSYGINITLDSWHDSSRNRDIPIKLYRPIGTGPFPVVIFSHGLGGSREGGKLWGSYWAEHGLIALHLQHPGSDKSLWEGQPAANKFKALKGAANAGELRTRVADVSFAISELVRHQQAGDVNWASADIAHIGMSGHSFGAVTTQSLAGEHFPLFGTRMAEPRIAAFIAFSPSARRDIADSFGTITRPFFSITGTADADPLGSGLQIEDRQKPYAAMPGGGKYLLVLDGRSHMFFNGDHTANDATEAAQQDLIKLTSLAFWRAYLQNDTAARAWLGKVDDKTADASWQSK